MRRAILGLLFLSVAFPAAAQEVAECYSIGAHHPFGNDISAARYVRFNGTSMVLTGQSGRHDLPVWRLACAPTDKGLFCSGHRRGLRVNVTVNGWQMKEMVWGRAGYYDERFHAVYNCDRAIGQP